MNGLKEAFSRENLLKDLNFFALLNLGLVLTAVGIVYFKNPNHFAFGGTSGLSILLADLFPRINVGGFMWIINLVLVVLGFIFLGIKCMGWTIYSSFALSFFVSGCEWLYPSGVSLSGDAMLDLVFAVFLPALGAAIVFDIGASTGGTEAIREVLVQMPADSPAIVITQHMPPGFTTSFAARLNSLCQITVKEAVNGERILPGHAYIAPGGLQFRIARSGANYVAVVEDAPPVNRHKPSVEVLFKSVAAVAGRNAYGIMLTGMGADGAAAMREMKDAGSYNYVQDEASCIVFGMPREAIAHGAADEVLPLTQIAGALVTKLRGATDRLHHRI